MNETEVRKRKLKVVEQCSQSINHCISPHLIQDLRSKALQVQEGGSLTHVTTDREEDVVCDGDSPVKIKFRNYQPYDRSLKLAVVTDNEVEIAPPIVDIIRHELTCEHVTDSCFFPKKANWDLKNQAAEKVEKLNRRTQRAIVEILRQKLSDDHESD